MPTEVDSHPSDCAIHADPERGVCDCQPTSDGLEATAEADCGCYDCGGNAGDIGPCIAGNYLRIARAELARVRELEVERLDTLRWKLTDRALDSDEGKYIMLEEFHDVWIAHLKEEANAH